MFEALKPLLESGILNEETRKTLEEAWNAKLDEARGQIRTEIREEMAARYEHDRTVMVEALDKMVNESLTAEVEKIKAEREAISEDRVKFTKQMMYKAKSFDGYLSESLANEIAELRNDRMAMQSSVKKLEAFVAENLQAEIAEFAQDKADLARTKVAVVTEGRKQLEALRESFVKKASSLVEGTVTNHLRSELNQLKTDIQEAKENNFGRKIFEAFSTEFGASYLNERADIKKLTSKIEAMSRQVSEAREEAERAMTEVKAKNQEIRRINESMERNGKLNDLLKALSKDKAAVMSTLLESVPTDKLDAAFKKYLNHVMEGAPVEAPAGKQVIAESRVEVTGDRTSKSETVQNSNIIEMKRLAGLLRN
jgi:outer membrane murein-binding lipoprotein Lpp